MKFEDYQPYGLTMYDHQKETATFILKNKRCFVFDSIGTGKTISSLSAYDFLMIHGKVSKVLVVAPISVMRSTWTDHILKFYPGRTFTVLHGTKAQRIANLKLDCNFYICNTDGIKILEKEIIAKGFDAVIIDESTTFASHSSQRTKAMWRISKKIPSVVCMSGAPIANDTLQSYAQAKLVNFNRPKYFTAYRDQLKIKYDMYTYHDRPHAIELAYSVLQPAIRHDMEDCLDLPPITYEYRDIRLTKEQEKHYKLMEKEYLTFLDGGEVVTAANAAVKYTKLLQISCGLIIDQEGNPTSINHKYRLKELKEILSQTKKVIIFATFTKSINSLLNEIPGSEKIDGSVNANQRYGVIKRFQEGDLDVLVCQPAAISHGVTLTAAHTIIWWSPCFSNEQYIQCNGRIRRPGQTKPQLIIKFRATKTEKKVYSALQRKEKVSQALLNFSYDED